MKLVYYLPKIGGFPRIILKFDFLQDLIRSFQCLP